MNVPFIFFSLGKLLEVLALTLLLPLSIAIAESYAVKDLFDGTPAAFAIAAMTSAALGVIMVLATHRRSRSGQKGIREGFAVVTVGWIAFSVLGAVPLWLYFLKTSSWPDQTAGRIWLVVRCFTDACFESMSGFTTTGASILTDIESIPKSLLFWRAMTNWLGGMGIVTLALVIFPTFGVTAYQMFRGEMPGPNKDRFTPRISHTAMVLWGIYVALTVVEIGLLMLGGMTLFDACCHAFATMATGGFSTKNLSIAAFRSAYIEWVVITFMIIAGTNFMLHYRMFIKGDFSVFKHDTEFLTYGGIILAVGLTFSAVLCTAGIASPQEIGRSFTPSPSDEGTIAARIATEKDRIRSPADAVRHAFFQTVSIFTTTGFSTADFDLWPQTLRWILVLLMLIGGCAGSTAGGAKVIRIIVALKAAFREIRVMIQPRLIQPLKVSGEMVEEKLVVAIMGFFVLYGILFAICTLLLSTLIPDLTTAATAVVACMCNIGPGLSGVGPTGNYAWIPLPGKWVLIAAMLLGRLEIFTVIVTLSPSSWKK